MAAQVKLYRTYRFIDKDPVIDEIRTLVQDEGLIKKLELVHQLSGVATTTIDNWFNGETKSPQNRTIMAVVTALGYKHSFVKERDLDVDKELKIAARWAEQQNSQAQASRRKKLHTHERSGSSLSEGFARARVLG
ncbi:MULTISPECIES: hypothetical protein [Bradyrhizobium]|uniref:hypothetical protein n=1 Tax=Bradyrhizobium elkanii TaxID=29448 RepID=UPI000421BDB5|nr:hypothetical protein [Bradyrhizobium elkanii]